jgi:hypothetical protein
MSIGSLHFFFFFEMDFVIEGLCMMLLVVSIQIKFKLVFLLEADPAKLDVITWHDKY